MDLVSPTIAIGCWMVSSAAMSILLLAQTGVVPGVASVAPTPVSATSLMDPAIFAAAVVTVISSVCGSVILVINAVSASKDRREASAERRMQLEKTMSLVKTTDKTDSKADILVERTGQIHELSNSTNANLQKALEIKTEEVAGLKRMVVELTQTREELARLVATAAQRQAERQRATDAQHAVSSPVKATDAIDDRLKAIENNTAATAENTANLEPGP